MKILRRIVLVVSGILALLNLFVVAVNAVTMRWGSMPWALARLALWTAVFVYLLRLDRRSSGFPS